MVRAVVLCAMDQHATALASVCDPVHACAVPLRKHGSLKGAGARTPVLADMQAGGGSHARPPQNRPLAGLNTPPFVSSILCFSSSWLYRLKRYASLTKPATRLLFPASTTGSTSDRVFVNI